MLGGGLLNLKTAFALLERNLDVTLIVRSPDVLSRLMEPQDAALIREALDYAGRNGVKAHRDIKPGNIFCADSGYKVGDFGIARRCRMGGPTGDLSLLAGAGTPGYMAPEQVLAPSTVDWRADLFSLSIVLYEALSGKKPFRGVRLDYDPDDDPTTARKILEAMYENPPPLRETSTSG